MAIPNLIVDPAPLPISARCCGTCWFWSPTGPAGRPRRAGLIMRQFTSWAKAVGGFLAHHGIEGFLANVETVRDIDDGESERITFSRNGGRSTATPG